MRFFLKNLRVDDKGDTLVTGQAVLHFVVDASGRYRGSCYEDAASNPLIALEVIRVAERLNKFVPMDPTRVKGRPIVSLVQLKVLFEMQDKPHIGSFEPDIRLVCSPPQY